MDDVSDAIVTHSRLVIVVLLVCSLAVGYGAPMVDDESSLSQFETDSTEAEKLEYVQSNFTADDNTTSAQVIVRGDNVLSRSSLLEQLRFQRSLTDNETVNGTLSDEQRPTGIANLVAVTAIRQEQAANLTRRGQALQAEQARLNRTGQRLSDSLNRTRSLQREYDRLNRSYARDQVDDQTYQQRSAAISRNLTAARESATANLSANQTETYTGLYAQTRDLQSRLDSLNASLAAGEINRTTYRERAGQVSEGFGEVYAGIEAVLAPEAAALQERGQALQRDQAALQRRIENGSTPPLSAQLEQVESMNASAVETGVGDLLGEGGAEGAFSLMPTDYQQGSTSAEATMIIVTQRADASAAQGSASERVQNAQLAIQAIGDAELSGQAMVFGAGIIADETNRSMQDSLAVVGPLALVFVLLVLTIAYRDIVDILLGVVGIGFVLLITFGYMGWTGISFNQIFVAVPVLLIGLSIDYAIHVFMRHREERADEDGGGGTDTGVRGSMRTALAGVATALVLVTATTVIGFLSNLISPVGPIQEFGVVSAVGIVAALVIFGALMPAIKIEIDDLLEGYGIDRRKRAFGTGGGAFSRVLDVGTTLARRAPWAVVVVTLLISAAGAYGATEVDTTFENEDFIAEEPPEWMDSLPENMRPGEYRVRETFQYVNDNFLREDSTAEFLYEGDVATGDALDRIDRTRSEVTDKGVVVTLSNDEPDIRSPLTVMESVAATNETFNATYTAADTDGDGIPDRNVTAVYDSLFETAPDRAAQVVYRTDDGYQALRLTVSIRGGASGGAVTNQMDAVESAVSGGDVTVTATGSPIVNKIVQDDLLQTVVESLIITLGASFVFLMVVYRLVEGSATLGLVTLLPVAFNVSWILGTMYALDIPFNVLTGMITSLTIGLGVAYSIHISERYSLELDRQSSAWGAMHTAVTGTGGALLGSAATTVGGFGVLVFAILPPLQQFGFITGLTIVYAFLASVFVLPSLLILWTRYVGPADALADDEAEGPTDAEAATADAERGPPSATVSGRDAVEAGADDARPATVAGNGTGVAADASTQADSGADPTPAAASDTGETAPAEDGTVPTATRTVTPEYVQPGGTVTVTAALSPVTDRTVLREAVPGTAVEVVSVDPSPVECVATGDRVYALWEATDAVEATLTYAVAVPDDAADGQTLAVDGEVLVPDYAVDVDGMDSVTVATDVVERLLSDGPVDVADLRDASAHLDSGAITPEQFERVYHAWLDERATADRTADDD